MAGIVFRLNWFHVCLINNLTRNDVQRLIARKCFDCGPIPVEIGCSWLSSVRRNKSVNVNMIRSWATVIQFFVCVSIFTFLELVSMQSLSLNGINVWWALQSLHFSVDKPTCKWFGLQFSTLEIFAHLYACLIHIHPVKCHGAENMWHAIWWLSVENRHSTHNRRINH